jgi:hypothetical protein
MSQVNPFYTYLQDDFKNATQINVQDLHDQIVALGLTSSTFDGFGIASAEDTANEGFYCRVVFLDHLLSGGEKTTLDATINSYTYVAPKTDTICYIKDVQSPGTNAGTFTSGTWQKRALNILIGNVNFAQINNSQITLQPNTYIITAKAPACDVQNHQIRLQNITDSSTQDLGTSSYTSGGIMTYSDLYTTFTITEQKVFELQHICYLSTANIGFGKANGWSDEIYSYVTIQKST